MRIVQTMAAAAAAALLVTATPGAAAADTDYWVPADDRLDLHGHGYGHGRGMSQHGAQGAALRGLAWPQIIDHYYPGTSIGSAGGRILVLITDDRSTALTVSPTRGLRLRDVADGKSWVLPTGAIDRWQLRISAEDKVFVMYHNDSGWHRWRLPGRGLTLRGEGEFLAPAPVTLWVAGDDRRRYRGYLRTARHFKNTVNVVSLESYVRGVIPREMPSLWEPAAVRSQAVAARSYAVRHRSHAGSRYYHVDDTISYQVYGGYDAEHPAANRAVSDTRAKIVTYGGAPALTEFSASSGGWSAGSSLPYQRVKRDPYDDWSGNSVHDWGIGADAGRLESRYPGIGEIHRIRVTDRNGGGEWGGRVEDAVLHGTQGRVSVSGNDLRSVLGLRSTWFTAERTAIIRKWHQIGARGSRVGDVVSGEYVTRDGVGQRFDNGRMYHKSGVGAHAVAGALMNAYARVGGAAGTLGFPTTDVRQAGREPGTQRISFERGRIYWSKPTGAHGIPGTLMNAYARVGGAAGTLGFPTTDVHRAGREPGTKRVSFEHGRIYWSKPTGAHGIPGTLMNAYARVGGAAGTLGFPTTDVHRAGREPGTKRISFEHGRIYWSKPTGAHEVHGPIMSAYADAGGAAGRLGFPTTGVRSVSGGERSDFQHGWIRWDRSSNKTTVHYD